MSATVESAPLLDAATLWTIATQLWSARTRLSLRTGGNIPSTTQFAIALRMYIAERDRQRLENTSSPQQQHVSHNFLVQIPETGLPAVVRDSVHGDRPIPDPPNISMLLHYLSIARAAYAKSEKEIDRQLDSIQGDSLLESKWFSEKWLPGYFVCKDQQLNCIFLSIRGSKEVSDFITNLCAETEPFLHGHGHQGIIKSAFNLQAIVRPRLAMYLNSFKPNNGLILVGHSLGGAVAAALAMILRSGVSDKEFDDRNENDFVRAAFRNVRCFSFAPPPFMNEELAAESRTMNITTIVNGLDMVPRLSAASLDRLLLSVSRYDWNTEVGQSIGRRMESATTGILGPQGARSLSSAIAQNGIASVTTASRLIGEGARVALEDPRASSSSLWTLALNAAVFTTSIIESQLASPQQTPDEEQDYSFAARFGMSSRDVEQSVVEEAPREMFLAGVIYHLETAFTSPKETNQVLASSFVEREASFFADVEPSGWMIHDHHAEVLESALISLL